MVKKCGLTMDELEIMTIGMCLDYIDEYIDQQNGEKKPKVRKATQADFDLF